MELPLLDRVLYGATAQQWLIAAGVFAAVYLILTLVRRLVESRLAIIAARTRTHVDDYVLEIVRRTRAYFLLALALQASMRVVVPDARAGAVLHGLTLLVVLIQVGVWGNGLIGIVAETYATERADGDIGARTTIRAVGYAGRFVLWALLLVTALDNFGIEITGLITGLGIGGIAVALAVQNILGDLFAALAIVVDKPFVVGEFIIVDTVMGTVEHVGLKTTRLRSLGGEQIIMSNADLLKSRIRNFKRMQERRIVFHIDVTYDTPADLADRIPSIVRSVIESQREVRFDRSHFLNWMDSSLRFETVYWVLAPDFNQYADTQHAINVELLRRFSTEGIKFAFPSRSVYLQPSDDASAPREARATS